MRWPRWIRGGEAAEDRGQVTDPTGTGSSTPASGAPTDSAWQSAAPIQRSLEAPLQPFTTSGGFASSLTAHQDPSFVGSLGHLVDADAPGGLVSGLASPVAAPEASYAVPRLPMTPERAPGPQKIVQRTMDWATFKAAQETLLPVESVSGPAPDIEPVPTPKAPETPEPTASSAAAPATAMPDDTPPPPLTNTASSADPSPSPVVKAAR